jgi:hypothetical protein
MMQATASEKEPLMIKHHAALRVSAKVLSYLFHPLFIPIYITWVLLWRHPLNALLHDSRERVLTAMAVFLSTAFFPAFSIFLLWRLRFIENLHIRQQRQRIIPYVISMFFFFWIYYVSRNRPDFFPLALRQLLMGIFLSSASALFANIYTKISMHGIAMGGLVGFAILQQGADVHWLPVWTHAAILIAGAVCTARLLLDEHKPVDVYAGFFVGVLCQVVARLIV